MSAVTAAEFDALDGTRLRHALRAGIRRLLQRQEHLNKINVFPVPDGDTGTNMALTLSAVLPVLRSRDEAHAGQMLTRVADAALDGARGNSGAILAQFFLGLCDRVGHLRQLTVHDFADGVHGGAIYARESLAEPREGTILTVLTDFAAEVRTQVARHDVRDFRALFDRALARARTSVEATRTQLESLRRANVVDAGALGFVEMLEGMTEYIETGRMVDDDVELVVVHEDESAAGQEENLEHRYCTECVVTALQIDRRHLREELATIGSSLVVAGTHHKARVHVHVNDPEAVFRIASKYGTVAAQKADDMQRQQGAAHHGRGRRVAVVTDSAADLPEEAMDRLDIHMVPVRVHFGEHSYLDKVSMSPEQFYQELATNPQHPKTSQPPPGDFRRAFEFLASHYDSVVYVGLTSQASGTMQSGQAAAQRCSAAERIFTADSRNASLGQGLVVMHAAELAGAGVDAAEVVRGTLAARDRTRTFALLATTEYAVRGGRVPAWAGKVASLLRVNPLLATFPDGRVSIGGALLGHRNLRTRFARFVRRRMTGGHRWRLAVAHANAPAEAERLLAELVDGRDDVESSFVIPLGTALGVHGGPGALVVAFQEVLPVPAHPPET